MEQTEHPDSGAQSPRWFTTTHWSVVLEAKSDNTTHATVALGKLCRTYWEPIHTYISSYREHRSEAEDLTQQFFARFLEKEHYKLANRERGRFRSFLLTAVKHFLINERERASALKRGRGVTPVSLDEEVPGEDRPRIELAHERTADQAYEYSWALALLSHVRSRLESEFRDAGNLQRFAVLENFLPGQETDLTYAQAAVQAGVPEGTIKSDVHRLKKRYRELLREEVAHTVTCPAEIDEELRHLVTVLSRPQC